MQPTFESLSIYTPLTDIIGACYFQKDPQIRQIRFHILNLLRRKWMHCLIAVTHSSSLIERFYMIQDKFIFWRGDVPIHAGIMPILNRNQALRHS